MRRVCWLLWLLGFSQYCQSLSWFPFTRKKKNSPSVVSPSEEALSSTRDKLNKVLSYYNVSNGGDLEPALISNIPSDLARQSERWNDMKKEKQDKDIETAKKSVEKFSPIRRYSNRKPMDGATFQLSDSVVKSEVIATEKENARLEKEKEDLIAAMAARQELKEQQKLQNEEEAIQEEMRTEEQQVPTEVKQGVSPEPAGRLDMGSWATNNRKQKPTKKIEFNQRLRLKGEKKTAKYKKGNVKIMKGAQKKGKSKTGSSFSTRHDALIFSRKTWCQNARSDYSIVSYESFGTATKAAKAIWKDYKCNKLLENKLSVLNPLADCLYQNSTYGTESQSLIAILVSVTTRHMKKPNLRDFDVFTTSMPSLMSSLDCGYRYNVVMGFDSGDPFFDSYEGMSEVQQWFQNDVVLPLEKNGIYMRLVTVAVKNELHKPGVVKNKIAEHAHMLGANYLYQIDDGTEFRERWPKLFVEALQSLTNPPLLGVVGPSISGEERSHSLIHDFVHRSHVDIFSHNYYPVDLFGVHLDQWVSRVYGFNRTLVATGVSVVKRTSPPPQEINSFIPQQMVTEVVVRGKSIILSWLRRNSSYDPSSIVAEYESPHAGLIKRIQEYPVDLNAVEDDELAGGILRDKHLVKNAKSHGERQKWCLKTKRIYNVKPYLDWGTNITEDQKFIWKEYACNMFFIAKKLNKREVSQCGGDNFNRSLAGEFPLIAVMAATTTRKISEPSVSNIALFTILLPSLVRSLDCGFRYMYVMGYDAGDKFFDTKKGLVKTLAYFNINVQEKMRHHGILVTLQLVKVHNILRKPGPVFIEMGKAAYASGADYFYRVNDDTELMHPWAKAYTAALQQLSAPYGVIGPFSLTSLKGAAKTKNRILTHDFVNRLHMEIFDMNYYPPELSDWWMDDWISHVYGRDRTFISHDCAVMHHTTTHGKRYSVDFEHEKLLSPLIKSGRKKILDWMTDNKAEVKVKALSEFSRTYKDYSQYTFNDIKSLK